LGGLVFMLASFFIIIINILILAGPVRMFYLNGLAQTQFITTALTAFSFNAALCAAAYFAGMGALKKLEG